MTSCRHKVLGFVLAGVTLGACGSPTKAGQSTTSSSPRIKLTAPAVTVTPSHALEDGQVVTVAVRGLPRELKFFVSECLDPVAAGHNGCGPQLAQQPLGVTDNSGDGSASFTVHSRAASTVNSQVFSPCTGECVLVVSPDQRGSPFLLAPITFTSATTTTGQSALGSWATCQTDQLRLATTAVGYASGQFTRTLVFENISNTTCELAGWPGVQSVVAGRPQPTTAIRVRQNSPPDPAWTSVAVPPGQMASFDIYGEDFDAAANQPCAQTTSGFLVIPPNDTQQMAVAVTQQDCGNRFYVAPVVAGGTDNLSWSTVVSQ